MKKQLLLAKTTLVLIILTITYFIISSANLHSQQEREMKESIYQFSANTISGENKSLGQYTGKVLLIVNTASKCGFTKQYEGLEKLYEKYKAQGFEILAFPCNQFGNQEPGTSDEIKEFCSLNYGVSFPIFEKIEVNGDNAHPLYKFLTKEKGGLINDAIKWNFTKFLIDKNGIVVGRFAPQTSPESLEKDIEQLLK
jgi:glutathione peroxidase